MSGKLISGPKVGYDLARLGAGAARGANRKNQLNAAAWSDTWPAPGSSLDLDFVNNRGWVRGVGQGGVMDAITFTRASDAYFVNSQGLLERSSLTLDPTGYVATQSAPINPNVFTWSEDFSNPAWTKTGLSISTTLEDPPSGIGGAFRITENLGAITLSELYNRNYGPNQFNVLSLYAKEDTTSAKRYLVLGFYYIGLTRWGYAIIDVATKDYVIRGDGIQNVAFGLTSTDAGNGWTRFSTTIQSPLASQRVVVGIIDTLVPSNSYNLGGYVGDGSSGMFITGAQLEISNEFSQGVSSRPRFDWGSTAQLPQKNLLIFTEQLDNPAWVSELSPDTVIGPTVDGLTTVTFTATSTSRRYPRRSSSFIQGLPGEQRYLRARFRPGAGITTLGLGAWSGTNIWSFAAYNITTQQWSYQLNGVGGTFTGISAIEIQADIWELVVEYNIAANQFPGASRMILNFGNGSAADLINNSPVGTCDIGFAQWSLTNDDYTTVGHPTTTTPIAANPMPNGILIEEARTNRVLWCRDATQTIPYTPPDNFFAQSETFTNASWNFDGNQAQLVRTENQSDPFDGTSATKIVPNAGRTAANAYIGQRSGASYPSTHSIYAKAAEYDYLVLSLFTYAAGNFAVFNLSDGTITTSPTVAGLTAAIESVGDGWYRCSLTTSNETLNRGFLVSVSPNGTTTATAAGGSGIFIYGAHSNNGDTPTTYVQTTVLDSPLWVLTDITAAKDQTGIDGVANAASSLTATANNGTCFQYTTLLSGVRTCSAYLKRITGTGVVQVSLDGVTWSTVDLSDTEWRRVVLSGVVANPALGIKLTTSGDSVAMDFAQVEDLQGASSPIFTTTASVTRVADVTGILLRNLNSSVIDANKFSAYAEFDFIFRNGSASGGNILALGTFNNSLTRAIIGIDGRNNVGFIAPRANSLLPIIGDIYKVFVSYKGGADESIAPRTNTTSIDGVSYPISANYFLLLSTPIDRIGIGCTYRNPTITNVHSGRIRRIILWPNDFSESVVTEYTK